MLSIQFMVDSITGFVIVWMPLFVILVAVNFVLLLIILQKLKKLR